MAIKYDRAKELEGWPVKMKPKGGAQHLGRGILVEVVNKRHAIVKPMHRHRSLERIALADLIEWKSGMKQYADDTGKKMP